jgi:hypothetical protein
MAVSRMSVTWSLLAAHKATQGVMATPADVCAVCVATVAVSGAALSAAGKTGMGEAGTGHVMCVTDGVSEQLEELQLTLGEGPRVDALAAGAPVLVPDLDASDIAGRWPAFGLAARLTGAAAMFAFPLQIGAIRVGALSLYRRQPGPLGGGQLGDSLLFADAATVLLLEQQDAKAGTATPAGDDPGTGSAPRSGADGAGTGPGGQPLDLGLHRAEIDQATGMLTEQLGVSIDEAFVRLRGYAYAHDRRLLDVARDLVGRTLRLGPGASRQGGAP